jgi:hypothetical protein
MIGSHSDISAQLRDAAYQLRELEKKLVGGNSTSDVQALRDFREALDVVRMKAWIMSELLNAEEIKTNPTIGLTFLASERIRSMIRLAKDLSIDIDNPKVSVNEHTLCGLSDALASLQMQLEEIRRR